METTFCPNCQHEAGFDPSTGELFCDLCGLLEPPDYRAMRKPFATCRVWQPIPGFRGSGGKHPWHAVYLEMHLMGIERGMYRKDLLSTRFNKAVGIEFMYKRKGLVTFFSMN
jgi:hypothetical protein